MFITLKQDWKWYSAAVWMLPVVSHFWMNVANFTIPFSCVTKVLGVFVLMDCYYEDITVSSGCGQFYCLHLQLHSYSVYIHSGCIHAWSSSLIGAICNIDNKHLKWVLQSKCPNLRVVSSSTSSSPESNLSWLASLKTCSKNECIWQFANNKPTRSDIEDC